MRRTLVGLALALSLLLTGCLGQRTEVDPTQLDRDSRPVTVATMGMVTTTDPAAATDSGSTMFVLNVFQRLMTVQVGSGAIKPDAASDCWFIDEITYSCGLRRGLFFTNGNELTASDVKFSIERAMALDVPGSSTRLLSSLDHIEVPEDDELRLDFKLKYPDNSFGYALASPAASIVDEETYLADEIYPLSDRAAGSGPFYVDVHTLDEIQFQRYGRYRGANGARSGEVVLKTYTTTLAMERAMATGAVDVLWKTPPAVTIDTQLYSPHVLEGAEVRRLIWNPESPHRESAEIRNWVRDATDTVGNLQSIIPDGVDYHVDSDTGNIDGTGGGGAAGTPPASPVTLTMGVAAQAPGHAELGEQVKTALEKAPTVTVTIVEPGTGADLELSDFQAWTNTALAWTQPWLEFPLAGQEERVLELEKAFRTETRLPETEAAAAAIQRQAAADATVVPLTQGDATFWMTARMQLDPEFKNYLGPNYQLGLWGFERE